MFLKLNLLFALLVSPPVMAASLCNTILSDYDSRPSFLGIPDEHVVALSAYTKEQNIFLTIRKPAPGSWIYHNDPHARGKPMGVMFNDGSQSRMTPFLFKSAQIGMLQGLVVKPELFHFSSVEKYHEALEIWERYWPEFRQHGYRLDTGGAVQDPSGFRFFSDYDVFLAFDSQGRRINFGRGGDHLPSVRAKLKPLNDAVGAEVFRHDGYYDRLYLEDYLSHPEQIILFTPSGEAFLVWNDQVPSLMAQMKSQVKNSATKDL